MFEKQEECLTNIRKTYIYLLLEKLIVEIACMFEAVYRFRSEAEKKFSKISLLNETFGFLNLHTLLRSGNIEGNHKLFKGVVSK